MNNQTELKIYSNEINKFRSYPAYKRLEFLIKYWKLEKNIKNNKYFHLIGQYEKSDHLDKKGKEFGYFIKIRKPDGDVLYYPFDLGECKVWAPFNYLLIPGELYNINITIDDSLYYPNNPFSLRLFDREFINIKNIYIDKINKEEHIKKIFNDTGYTPRDAKNTARALKNLMGDLYTETERFIFELLQNADDQPSTISTVKVSLYLFKDNLVFLHNGKPFDEVDVESICAIGDSTKSNDSEKIGYKGIGFKSVFSDSETVYINSGGYSFSFDKTSTLYKDTENIEDVPWQIKPIWIEKYVYPKTIQELDAFFKSSVAFSLEIEHDQAIKYKHIIPKLFEEPCFTLFLRNISSISYEDFNGKCINIQKKYNNDICTIFVNNKEKSSWITEDFIFDIPEATKKIIIDDNLVPQKLKNSLKAKLSFAILYEDNKIVRLENEQSVLFTYLPTKVHEFQFPFLINGDFLTTASRENIHLKNHWNIYLFKCIGEKILDLAIHLSKTIQNYLDILPRKLISTKDEAREKLASAFNDSYQLSLEKHAFILDLEGNLCKQTDIIIDETGISNIIGAKLFYDILHTKKHLPSTNIDINSLKNPLFDKIERVNDEIFDIIIDNPDFNTWFLTSKNIQKNYCLNF